MTVRGPTPPGTLKGTAGGLPRCRSPAGPADLAIRTGKVRHPEFTALLWKPWGSLLFSPDYYDKHSLRFLSVRKHRHVVQSLGLLEMYYTGTDLGARSPLEANSCWEGQ